MAQAEGGDTDLISHRAELFRSKLIADFHLLDTIKETGGTTDAPKYETEDLIDPAQQQKILKQHPDALVRFQMYTKKAGVSPGDRRQNRVRYKNSKNPSLDVWAHWVVESAPFQNSVLALILLNSVVLGVQGELSGIIDERVEKIKLALDIFDYCTMFVYMMEIFLKWIDDFWGFWKNRWNIFDFFVTFLFLIPEIINFSTGEFGKRNAKSDLTVIANNLRTFRILRSLKMVSRFQKVRLIVLAVTKAFQAMVFITVLLLVFAYIFAIIGVSFFKDGYVNAQVTGLAKSLKYEDSFTSIGTALITLFQLFTLDHWLAVYRDITSVTSPLFGAFYVILWIIIGSFIFRNIFAGIMVNNFQSIRKDLFQEVKEMKEREQHDADMMELAGEMERQLQKQTSTHAIPTGRADQEPQAGPSHTDNHIPPGPTPNDSRRMFETQGSLREAISDHVISSERQSLEWQRVVERHLYNLSKEETSYCWPKDTLFRYFQVMEALQENLTERQEILTLANETLIHLHDT